MESFWVCHHFYGATLLIICQYIFHLIQIGNSPWMIVDRQLGGFPRGPDTIFYYVHHWLWIFLSTIPISLLVFGKEGCPPTFFSSFRTKSFRQVGDDWRIDSGSFAPIVPLWVPMSPPSRLLWVLLKVFFGDEHFPFPLLFLRETFLPKS